jgi:transmembrane sensor
MNDQAVRKARTEAAVWFTRLSRRSITTEQLREFRDWKQDSDNAAAYAHVEETWRKAGALSADPEIRAATDEALRSRPHLERRTAPKLAGPAGLSLGLAALGAAAGLTTWAVLDRPATYTTGVGEQRLVVLTDGSRMRLNTDSLAKVRFRGDERRVELSRGEAFFDVRHDTARPFVVQANGARIVDLGTRFNVLRRPGDVQITLLEGQVQVFGHEKGPAQTLTPNQQVLVTPAGPSAPRPVDAELASSWTTGRLVFHDMALKDAVAEVNRYATDKVVLDGPADLAQRPVSGVFNTGDTDAFVAAVKTLFALRSNVDPGGSVHLAPGPNPDA